MECCSVIHLKDKSNIMEFIYSQRWCELVFENRNKNYGAYHLRQNESSRILHSWLIAITIIATAIFGIAISGGPSVELIQQYSDKTQQSEIIYNFNKVTPPPQPSASTSIAVKSNGNGIPVVTDRKIQTIEPLITTPVTTVPTLNSTGSGTSIVPFSSGSGTTDAGTTVTTTSDFTLMPEVFPEFPGGEEALIRYVQKNIIFPHDLIRRDISGTVYVGFIIDKSGHVSNIKILKGIDNAPELSVEAIRVLEKSPVWKPGLQGGKPVAVAYTLPVTFTTK